MGFFKHNPAPFNTGLILLSNGDLIYVRFLLLNKADLFLIRSQLK